MPWGAHIRGEAELPSAWTGEAARPHAPVPTRSLPCQGLLFNYAAGDAVAGVACGIGLLVVGLGVHYECCSAVAEE